MKTLPEAIMLASLSSLFPLPPFSSFQRAAFVYTRISFFRLLFGLVDKNFQGRRRSTFKLYIINCHWRRSVLCKQTVPRHRIHKISNSNEMKLVAFSLANNLHKLQKRDITQNTTTREKLEYHRHVRRVNVRPKLCICPCVSLECLQFVS